MGEIDLKRAAVTRKRRLNYDRGEEALKKLGFFHTTDLAEEPELLLEAIIDHLVDCLHGADRLLDLKVDLRPLVEAAHGLFDAERREALQVDGEDPESQ